MQSLRIEYFQYETSSASLFDKARNEQRGSSLRRETSSKVVCTVISKVIKCWRDVKATVDMKASGKEKRECKREKLGKSYV